MSYSEMGKFQVVMDFIGLVLVGAATIGMILFLAISGICNIIDELI